VRRVRPVAGHILVLDAMSKHYNFGIEIEAVAKPYGGGQSFTNIDWYRQLAQKLRNRGISAVHDDNSRYSKHPEYYGGKWFVTRDGSLKRPKPFGEFLQSNLQASNAFADFCGVCMEVVSPKLNTTQDVTEIFSDFWEAMRVHFNPQKDISCGGHVHVTPLNLTSKFSLKALKRIAFATVFYEDFIDAILPQARIENKFCIKNSRSPGSGISEAMSWGKSPVVLQQVATNIKSLKNEVELYMYMQGDRYVLWNFQNTIPNPKTGRSTGTIEFRGGNQFLSTSGTLAWLAFVLGFVTLALKQVSHEFLLPIDLL
jgi:hypothetical protein